jgi:hypothetical protein
MCQQISHLSLDHLLIDDANSSLRLHEPIMVEWLHQYVCKLVVGPDDFNLHPAIVDVVSDVVVPCINVLTMIMQDRISAQLNCSHIINL